MWRVSSAAMRSASFKHPKGPEGDVLQVADGRGDDVERADGAHLKTRSGIISTWGSSPARVTATTSKRTGVSGEALGLEVVIRQPAQPALLGRSDRLLGRPEPGTPAGS